MTPYEIMLSESQERMLLVVKQGREAEVERIFDKWDLHAVAHRRGDRRRHAAGEGSRRVVAEIPNRALTDEAPVYRPSDERPGVSARGAGSSISTRSDAGDGVRQRRAAARCSARRPSPASGGSTGSTTTWCGPTRSTCRAWAPASSAIKGTDRALAMSVDGNGRYCYLDPRRGAMLAVAEAARNVACAGARPLGATNCLNFGNPERPGDHVAVREGGRRASARRAGRSDVPITGGNVSLYNETDGTRDLSDAGHRRRRAARARRSRASAGASRRRATRSCCSARAAASSAAASI